MIMPEFRNFGLTFQRLLTGMIFGATNGLCQNLGFLVNQ